MTEPPVPPAAPPARIVRLDIEGFRVIDKLSLELRPMNVLIGENGSGKSTVLEALEILSKAATMSGRQFFNELYDRHGGTQIFRRAHDREPGGQLSLGVEAGVLGHTCRYKLVLQAQRDCCGRSPTVWGSPAITTSFG